MIHFTRAEFIRSTTAQDRGIDNRCPDILLSNLDFTMAGAERIRAILEAPIVVLSGYRCPDLNAAVGGAESSQHMAAQAMDFTSPRFGPPIMIAKALAPLVRVLGIDQLILEPTWVHVSFTHQPRYSVLRKTPRGYEQGI